MYPSTYSSFDSFRSTYRYFDHVINDSNLVISSYPHLHRKTDLCQNVPLEGKVLYRLQGTIPIVYQNNVYNIPLSVWYPPNFPCDAPHIFIEPTGNMSIFATQHVDASGRVHHPLLSTWSYPTNCNLCYVLSMLTHEFGRLPPLFQSAPNAGPGVAPESTRSRSSAISPAWEETIVNMQPIIYEKLAYLRKKMALNNEYSQKLTQGQHKIENSLETLDRETEKTDSHVEQVDAAITEMKAILTEMRRKDHSKPTADAAIMIESPLEAKLLDSMAAWEALQDLYPIMIEALKLGTISLDTFLQEVASAADTQFHHRALCFRILEELKP